MQRMKTAAQSKQKPAGFARALLALLLSLSLLAAADPVPPRSRAQALQALAHAEATVRRQAAGRLGEVGVMADVPALLRALRDDDELTRMRAEQSLWQIWGRSGDAQVDQLYQTGVGQMNSGELHKSIATFSRIIEIRPGFAEGWNKRATLYFLIGEYDKSLADCAQVIKRNPYHFGALAGYGQIYLRLEDYALSLEYFRRALELNPNMDGVRLEIRRIEQLLEERRKNMI